MATILQMTFLNAFFVMKMRILIKIPLKFVPKGHINKITSISSDDALAPTRRQAVIWTNYG